MLLSANTQFQQEEELQQQIPNKQFDCLSLCEIWERWISQTIIIGTLGCLLIWSFFLFDADLLLMKHFQVRFWF